jgi:hypothetical protein
MVWTTEKHEGEYIMAWRTIGYRIEKCYIPTYDGSRLVERHFLDAVQVDEKSGRKSSTNIVNGTLDYCQEFLNKLLPIVETPKFSVPK